MRGSFASGRNRLAIVVSTVVCFAPGVTAWAESSARVAMPFRCSLEQGRVQLAPSPERAYRIVGQHRQHPFTACAPGQPDRCRTWMIHRFDMQCGTALVPWASVVAAANDRPPRRLRLESGRIHIAVGPTWRAPTAKGGKHPIQPQGIALPPGYAPVVGLAARFTATDLAERTRTVEPPRPRPAVMNEPALVERGGLQPVSAPAAGDAGENATEPAPPIGDWVTTTERVRPADGAFDSSRVLALMMIIVALWLATDLVRAQRSKRTAAGGDSRQEPEGLVVDADAAHCSELIATAVNLHRKVRERLSRVSDETARKLLAEDLAEVQAALLSDRLTEQVAGEAWTPVRDAVEQAIADLNRIARRAETALSVEPNAAAPADVSVAASEPASVGEAFQVLGINPEASRTVVKKIVEGLRQSWHPDLARDEADRLLRECRMKQINVAWDIISGRRQAA